MKTLVFLTCIFFSLSADSGTIPLEARKYKRDLVRWAHYYEGLDAPIPMYAAQIHQESAWRPHVSSKYADGLTQFTPSTAKWMGEIYKELRPVNSFDPVWSIRAMILYNKKLAKGIVADNECELMSFVLASYNGGKGWVLRDKKLAKSAGDNPYAWWGSVENYSDRSDWAFKENRDYPRKILFEHQPLYERWSGRMICEEKIDDKR